MRTDTAPRPSMGILMPDKPKIKRVSTDSRRWKLGTCFALIEGLKLDELECVDQKIKQAIKRVKRERREVQAVVK